MRVYGQHRVRLCVHPDVMFSILLICDVACDALRPCQRPRANSADGEAALQVSSGSAREKKLRLGPCNLRLQGCNNIMALGDVCAQFSVFVLSLSVLKKYIYIYIHTRCVCVYTYLHTYIYT